MLPSHDFAIPYLPTIDTESFQPRQEPTSHIPKPFKIVKKLQYFPAAAPRMLTGDHDHAKPILMKDGGKKRYMCPFPGCEQRYTRPFNCRGHYNSAHSKEKVIFALSNISVTNARSAIESLLVKMICFDTPENSTRRRKVILAQYVARSFQGYTLFDSIPKQLARGFSTSKLTDYSMMRPNA
jgi:hypothetical protein